MKVVYAQYARPINYNIQNAKGHWGLNYVEPLVLAYSAIKSKEFFGHTKLVADEYSRKYLIDEIGIPFDEVQIMPDDIEKTPMYWAAGKIWAYTKAVGEFEPFIFMDNDAGFHNRPPEHYTSSRFRGQHVHCDTYHRLLPGNKPSGNVFWQLVKKMVQGTPNVYPYDIIHDAYRHPEGVKGINAGILVFGDKEHWEMFSKYTWDLMESDFLNKVAKESMTSNLYNHMNFWNVVVEEILLLQCYRRLRWELPQTIFEFDGLKPTPGTENVNPSGYFHIWGKKSNLGIMHKWEKIATDYIPKEITERVYDYFKVKK